MKSQAEVMVKCKAWGERLRPCRHFTPQYNNDNFCAWWALSGKDCCDNRQAQREAIREAHKKGERDATGTVVQRDTPVSGL